jgi:hypothetical protein
MIMVVPAVAVQTGRAEDCPPGLLQQAFALWEGARFAAADSVYVSAIGPDSSCVRALWGAAMARLDVGCDQPDVVAQRAAIREAAQLARRAVAVAPDDTWAHLYLGAALGHLALREGVARKVELVRAIKREGDLALAADSTNARAHHLLGCWHREVATMNALSRAAAKIAFGGLPQGATLSRALWHFERALTLEPKSIHHHLEYARTLVAAGRDDHALAALRAISGLPESEPRDPQYRQEALALRRTLLRQTKAKGRDFGQPD